jgi:hypothetical protein
MLLSSSAFAQQTHSLDVKVEQRIKLRDMGGPNVQLIVNGVDQFDVSVTLIDTNTCDSFARTATMVTSNPASRTSNSRSRTAAKLGFSIAAIAAFTTCLT